MLIDSELLLNIINFIEERVRELFYREGTEFDFSPWVQAALLLEQIVIPCDYYFPETQVRDGKKLDFLLKLSNSSI